ncbi:MAG: TPM domain-containing protein [Ignavibacterium sp.]|uniref:TPM domain-containing protein n=1 Tax=Ignavibacterium sp. TaxID=2651167 RepID=UPI004049878B
MSQRIIYNFFSDDELLRISNKIKEAEKNTSAEIVVVIKEKRKLLESKKAIRELAEDEFIRTGIGNTSEKTGVLIFILLSEKQFYILADKKISDKIPQQTFDSIANEMSNQFKSGKFSTGIINCINKLSELLSRDFPIKPNDLDELSNKILVN